MSLNDRSSLLSHLKTRRSAKPEELNEPGPSRALLAEILEIAARTPDHGALCPYRFVIIDRDQRDAFAALLGEAIIRNDADAHDAKIAKSLRRAHLAPWLILLISSPIPDHKIPVWEQELCCGAVGMNLLHAVHAHGFAGSWITGWAAYDGLVHDAFCREGERIAGFFYIGTALGEAQERTRPTLDDLVSNWSPPKI